MCRPKDNLHHKGQGEGLVLNMMRLYGGDALVEGTNQSMYLGLFPIRFILQDCKIWHIKKEPVQGWHELS